jgi:hypothetical protein
MGLLDMDITDLSPDSLARLGGSPLAEALAKAEDSDPKQFVLWSAVI